MLIRGMTAQEIRILQEFRRVARDTMDLVAITAIKHPVGGGDAPALSLVAKGLLSSDPSAGTFSLTDRAREFLTYDPKPEWETGAVKIVETEE